MAKKGKKKARNDEPLVDIPAGVVDVEPDEFGDEEKAFDDFSGREIRIDQDTPEGTTFQGMLIGAFRNPNAKFKDIYTGEPTHSLGFNFIDRGGEKVTFWGADVLNRLIRQYPPPSFVTIRYTGRRGKNNVKMFEVESSQAGFEHYKHLLDKINLEDYEWDEPFRLDDEYKTRRQAAKEEVEKKGEKGKKGKKNK